MHTIVIETEEGPETDIFMLGIREAFIKTGNDCEFVLQPLAKRGPNLNENLQALVERISRLGRRAPFDQCTYIAPGTLPLAEGKETLDFGFAIASIVRKSRIVGLRLLSFGEYPTVFDPQAAFIAAGLERQRTIGGTTKVERVEAQRMIDTVQDGMETALAMMAKPAYLHWGRLN